MMELEEFGDSVEQLEDYCHRAGLGRVIIKESLHYGSTEVMVKVGNKQVVATAKSASSGREKAALLWLDHFAPRSGASSLASRCRSLKPQQIKPESNINCDKAEDDEAHDNLMAEDSDVDADLNAAQEFLRELYGFSPSLLKTKERTRKSSPPSVDSGTVPSTLKTQEGKVSPEKADKSSEFKFNKGSSLESDFTGKEEVESSIRRSVIINNEGKKELFEVKKEMVEKMEEECGNTENSPSNDVSDLLDSSNSDSETFQEVGKKLVSQTEDLLGSSNYDNIVEKKVSKQAEDEDDWSEVECEEEESLKIPSIDELLKLPETEGTSEMDDILDRMDLEIKENQAKHEREMILLDLESESLKKKGEEREKRRAANAILKARLARDLTRPVLGQLFTANLPYLEDIKAGRIKSARHTAFHTNLGSRQALLYQMINNPFTSDHVDWTYEEMARIWTKTSKDYHNNNDYIWKVLMPECFIKFYMDIFDMPRMEAETRIRETPLDEEDDIIM